MPARMIKMPVRSNMPARNGICSQRGGIMPARGVKKPARVKYVGRRFYCAARDIICL